MIDLEGNRRSYVRDFAAMRDEVRTLLASGERPRDPGAALGGAGVHLYTRYAERLMLLRRESFIERDQLPTEEHWVRHDDALGTRDLRRLADELDQILAALEGAAPRTRR